MSKFASLRLGKTSVEDIRKLVELSSGIRKDDVIISVKCTQVPQEFEVGTYVFIWLGSDNNKGIPTEWKQGYKAIGKLQHINRGEKFNDESTSDISIEYIFENTFNRLDILSVAPQAYYLCSALPVIGLDDHSNQTIRLFNESEERCDIKAFFSILSTLNSSFQKEALKIDATWKEYLGWKPSGDIIKNKQELESKVRESFTHFVHLINTHTSDFTGYIAKFEEFINPKINSLFPEYSNIFQIVDIEILRNIVAKLKEADPSLEKVFTTEYNGTQYQAFRTMKYYDMYLDILADSDFRANISKDKEKRLEIASSSHPEHKPYLRAMRTKPFLLLAGISGTGKSRIVKQMAFDSCPNGSLREDKTSPGNYCLIEVKPNWHDSTELLGFESRIGGAHYVLTPFVKFLAKAMLHSDVPFFVCLDEMNLAPVEQYFAEFLSVLESRTKDDDHIISEPLVKADIFKKYPTLAKQLFPIEEGHSDYCGQGTVEPTAPYGKEVEVYETLKREGLRIPENVVVIGTVNMDETTHQFSRKVIDRAMTIEMNLPDGEPFLDFYNNKSQLVYRDNPTSAALYLSNEVKASDVIDALAADNAEKTEWLKGEVAKFLNDLNNALEGTPFKVAYRVQNELLLYFYQLWHEDKSAKWRDILTTSCDQILMMKVLPRIEGDAELLEKPLEKLNKFFEDNNFVDSKKKIEDMKSRLEGAQFTSFWP